MSIANYWIEKIRYYDTNATDFSAEYLGIAGNYGDALEKIKRDITRNFYAWKPSKLTDPFFYEVNGNMFYAYQIVQLPENDCTTFLECRKVRETPVQVYDPYQVKHNLISCGIV